ncbi:hypothetical protein BKI52_17220 [marine bacterium AO1-C]|nr:hypothetical protein BKI52_17220 [marine bacterium AO1-C]
MSFELKLIILFLDNTFLNLNNKKLTLNLDHNVILVNNLDQAIEDYTQLGFTVSPGGAHAGGISRNALIHFQDGTFLELLVMETGGRTQLLKQMYTSGLLKNYQTTAKYGMAYRFYGRTLDLGGPPPNREGMTDFCLLADHEAGDYSKMQSQNVALTPPYEASRLRPDGQTVSWKMYTALDDALPFFRTDYYPKITRPAAALQHANGVTGTQKIILFVEDYSAAVQSYQQLFKDNPSQQTEDSLIFTLNNGIVEIIDAKNTSRKEDLALVKAQGIGRFAQVMLSNNPDFAQQMQQGNTHGLVFLQA